MDNVLGRKQRTRNSDWTGALARIGQVVSRKELDRLVEKTVDDIRKKTRGQKAAYAWSGGKDSLVIVSAVGGRRDRTISAWRRGKAYSLEAECENG